MSSPSRMLYDRTLGVREKHGHEADDEPDFVRLVRTYSLDPGNMSLESVRQQCSGQNIDDAVVIQGNSPLGLLSFAVWRDCLELVAMILELGADPLHKCYFQTAFCFVRSAACFRLLQARVPYQTTYALLTDLPVAVQLEYKPGVPLGIAPRAAAAAGDTSPLVVCRGLAYELDVTMPFQRDRIPDLCEDRYLINATPNAIDLLNASSAQQTHRAPADVVPVTSYRGLIDMAGKHCIVQDEETALRSEFCVYRIGQSSPLLTISNSDNISFAMLGSDGKFLYCFFNDKAAIDVTNLNTGENVALFTNAPTDESPMDRNFDVNRQGCVVIRDSSARTLQFSTGRLGEDGKEGPLAILSFEDDLSCMVNTFCVGHQLVDPLVYAVLTTEARPTGVLSSYRRVGSELQHVNTYARFDMGVAHDVQGMLIASTACLLFVDDYSLEMISLDLQHRLRCFLIQDGVMTFGYSSDERYLIVEDNDSDSGAPIRRFVDLGLSHQRWYPQTHWMWPVDVKQLVLMLLLTLHRARNPVVGRGADSDDNDEKGLQLVCPVSWLPWDVWCLILERVWTNE